MPGTGSAQKAKIQPAGQGKNLASILQPMEIPEAAPCATKVIFTIGPACQDVDTLAEILTGGATCARIDLTWGPLDFHRKSLENLGKAILKTKRLCAVMLDTLGREVFVCREVEIGPDGWPKHGEEVAVAMGSTITLTTTPGATFSSTTFPVNYPSLPEMVREGDQLYIGRYLVTGADAASLYLEVRAVRGSDIECVALNTAQLGGLLTVYHMERSEKGVENKSNQQPLFAEHDTSSIRALANDFEIDFLSLSYTRTAADVHEARALLSEVGLEQCRIVAKLDAKQSLLNFRGILAAADGIMLSRGNLGLDCLPEKIAIIQKNVTTSCNLLGKPVIITRIVDTMVNSPRPTRAEATDVANAVLDGTDCLLLGAETLRGMDPGNAVRTVVACCHAAEAEFQHTDHFDYLMREAMKAQRGGIAVPGGADQDSSPDSSVHGGNGAHNSGVLAGSTSHANLASTLHAMTRNAPQASIPSSMNLTGMHEGSGRLQLSFLAKLEALASSAVRAAEKAAARLLIVFTDTGLTASLVAKYRPSVPILTLVVPRLINHNLQWKVVGRHVARQCQLTRGLVPMLAVPSPDGERVMRDAIAAAAERKLLAPGDHAVCVEKISGDYCIKMVSVDSTGRGLQRQSVLVHSLTLQPHMVEE